MIVSLFPVNAIWVNSYLIISATQFTPRDRTRDIHQVMSKKNIHLAIGLVKLQFVLHTDSDTLTGKLPTFAPNTGISTIKGEFTSYYSRHNDLHAQRAYVEFVHRGQ